MSGYTEEEKQKWLDFYNEIANGSIESVRSIFLENQKLFQNIGFPNFLGFARGGWSAVSVACAQNRKEIMQFLIHECDFDIHFINHTPDRRLPHYHGAGVLHFVADDFWDVYADNEAAHFEMLDLLINFYHCDESIKTTNHAHTYRDFMALRSSRYGTDNKYKNRLENFDKYMFDKRYRWTLQFYKLIQNRDYINDDDEDDNNNPNNHNVDYGNFSNKVDEDTDLLDDI